MIDKAESFSKKRRKHKQGLDFEESNIIGMGSYQSMPVDADEEFFSMSPTTVSKKSK